MLDSLADYLDIFADNFVHLGPTYIPYPKMRFVDEWHVIFLYPFGIGMFLPSGLNALYSLTWDNSRATASCHSVLPFALSNETASL